MLELKLFCRVEFDTIDYGWAKKKFFFIFNKTESYHYFFKFIFLNLFFHCIELLIMEYNFIHIIWLYTALAGLDAPHTVGPIFEHIFDGMRHNIVNGNANIVLENVNRQLV